MRQEGATKTRWEKQPPLRCGGKRSCARLPLRPRVSLIIASIFLATVAVAAPESMDDSKLLTADYPDWFLETFLDLQDDLNNARESNKKGLIVVFSTVGCSYCYKFADETLRDPEVVANLRRDFDALALEIFSDDFMISPSGEELPVVSPDGNRTIASAWHGALGFNRTPALAFFDTSGKLVLQSDCSDAASTA